MISEELEEEARLFDRLSEVCKGKGEREVELREVGLETEYFAWCGVKVNMCVCVRARVRICVCVLV